MERYDHGVDWDNDSGWIPRSMRPNVNGFRRSRPRGFRDFCPVQRQLCVHATQGNSSDCDPMLRRGALDDSRSGMVFQLPSENGWIAGDRVCQRGAAGFASRGAVRLDVHLTAASGLDGVRTDPHTRKGIEKFCDERLAIFQ